MSKDRIYNCWHIEHWFYMHHMRIIAIVIRGLIRLVFSCDVPYQVRIGQGTSFPHDGLGMILHQGVIIGQNCRILHGVTMGGNGGDGIPKVGDNVIIGACSILIGGITIGNDAIVGAGSVVTKDVPEKAVVAGNPAKILRYKE